MEFIPSYIKRKHGQEPVEYMLPELIQTLSKQYGNSTVASERDKLINDL
ncbi:hypothetical protein KAZ93_02390 [Patescibacteria group bacterium]|nr:hypothetical protein [Patescibacteria group bacterium]